MTDNAEKTDEGDIGRIVILGDNSTVIGFKLAGVKRAYEVGDDAALKLEEHMADGKVSIIAVSEGTFDALPHELRQKAEESIRPIVVTIPGREGGVGKTDALKALIRRAIGFDMTGE